MGRKLIWFLAVALVPLIVSHAAAQGTVTATITFGTGTISGSGTSVPDCGWTNGKVIVTIVPAMGGKTILLTVAVDASNNWSFKNQAAPAGNYVVISSQNFVMGTQTVNIAAKVTAGAVN